MSWLKSGVDIDNSLLGIEDVPSGRTHLVCPYCGGRLTAKKGRIKEHHFAHTDETCQSVRQRQLSEIPTLPLYDSFNVQLSKQNLSQLKRFWERYGKHNYGIPNYPACHTLERAGVLRWNEYRRAYEFTKLGSIPVGGLSLNLFNCLQSPMLLEKLQKIELLAYDTLGITTKETSLPIYLTDLRLYRTQLRRVLAQTLYYLEVYSDGQTFYKVGVTTRKIDERVEEVKAQLFHHFQAVKIKVLGTWQHRGNVEKYFKYRYQRFNYPIGTLSEYYKFDNVNDAKGALRDLRRMKPKVLNQEEIDILEGKPSFAEITAKAELEAIERSPTWFSVTSHDHIEAH